MESKQILTNTEFYKDLHILCNQEVSPIKIELDSDLSKMDPKYRHHFFKGEKLFAEEDETIEYKNYKMPLDLRYDSTPNDKHTQELIDQLKKQICGFLNKKGGRIYIGINDEKIVIGVQLSHKDRDKTRNDLTNLTSDFYPKCRTEKIKIIYIPVKDRLTNKFIKNLFVIKIIILQGEVDRLYSTTSKGYKSFMRLQGQSVELSSEEIERNLIARKNGEKLIKKIAHDEFDDTEIAIPVISEHEEEIKFKCRKDLNMLISSKSNDNLHKEFINYISRRHSVNIQGREVINLLDEEHNEQLPSSHRSIIISSSNVINAQDEEKSENISLKIDNLMNYNKEYTYKDKKIKINRNRSPCTIKNLFNHRVKVTICNLNEEVTKDDIINLLKDYPFDSSVPISLKRINGFQLVYAVVYFNNPIDAIIAKQSLDGSELKNCKIEVKILSD